MKISSIVGKDKLTLSFEVFPPKTDSDFEKVKEAAFGVAAIKPAYISVTYGAGGSTSTNTLAIAKIWCCNNCTSYMRWSIKRFNYKITF